MTATVKHELVSVLRTLLEFLPRLSVNLCIRISVFHRAFFNSIIDEYQHIHFFTFNTVVA